MSNHRKSISYSAQEKVAFLRAHLVERVPVSGVCQKHGISVTSFCVLRRTDVLRQRCKESRRGKGCVQPLKAHKRRHVYVAWISIAGTFVFMTTGIDGFSRLVVAWDIAPQTGEKEIEILFQKGRERFPS
jgi:hypothetical protein